MTKHFIDASREDSLLRVAMSSKQSLHFQEIYERIDNDYSFIMKDCLMESSVNEAVFFLRTICKEFDKLSNLLVNGVFLRNNIIKTILKFSLFFYQLCRSQNGVDTLVAISQLAMTFEGYLTEKTLQVFLLAKPFLPSQESNFTSFNKIKSILLGTMKCSFTVELKKIFKQVLALKILPKSFAQTTASWIGKPEKGSGSYLDLMEHVLNFSETLVKMSDCVMEGMSFTEALLSRDPVSKTVKETLDLLKYKDFLYIGVGSGKDEIRMQREEFIAKLATHVKNLRSFDKELKNLSSSASKIYSTLVEAEKVLFEKKSEVMSEHRSKPLAIMFAGPPGIGKTVLLKHMEKLYCKIAGIEHTPSVVYNRQVSSDYWENYDPFGQPIVHYSEVGSMTENLAKNKGDPAVAELTSVIDECQYPVNMAFEGKGKTFFLSKLVLMDTNCPDLNLLSLVKNPSAFKRRIMEVYPTVKPDFRDGAFSIDPEKSLAEGGDIMDRWTFKIVTHVSQGNLDTEENIIMKAGSIYDFDEAITKLITDHLVQSEKKKEAMQNRIIPEQESASVVFAPWIVFYQLLPIYFLFMLMCGSYILNAFAIVVPFVSTETLEAFMPFYETCLLLMTLWTSPLRNFGKCLALFMDHFSAYVPFFNLPKEWKQACDMYRMELLRYETQRVAEKAHFARSWSTILATDSAELAKQTFYTMLSLTLEKARDLAKKSPKIFILLLSLGIIWFHIFSYWLWPGMILGLTLAGIGGLALYSDVIDTIITLLVKYRSYSKTYSSFLRVKRRFHTHGSFIRSRYGKEVAAGFALFFVAALGVIKVYKTTVSAESSEGFVNKSHWDSEMKEKEDENSCGYSYERKKVHGTNIWNTIETPLSKPKSRNTLESTHLFVCKNVRDAAISINGVCYKTKILGVQGNYALINRHFLYDTEPLVTIKIAPTGKSARSALKFLDTTIYKTDMIPIGDDLLLFQVSNIQFKDILDLFPEESFNESISHSSFMESGYTRAKYHGFLTMNSVGNKHAYLNNAIQYQYSKHRPGLCGYPLLADYAGGSHIIGLHCAGESGTCYAQAINRLELESGMKNKTLLHPIHSESAMFETTAPLSKSLVNYEIIEPLRYHGKLPGKVMVKSKSKVKLTPHHHVMQDILQNSLKDNLGKHKFGAPLMEPKVINGEYLSPWNITINAFHRDKLSLDRRILRRIINEMKTRISNKIVGRTLSPLTVECAINSIPEDDYLRSMKASTSAGYGFNGLKSEYLPITSDFIDSQIREPVDSLKQRICEMLDLYKKGECVSPVYEGCLKDEVRSAAKIAAGKTRVFYISPLDHLLISRMFLAPFYTLMSEFNETFGCSVGINIIDQADNFVKNRLLAFENIVVGDLRNFDISSPFDIRWAANTLISEILSEFGYNDSASQVVNGILSDNLFIYFTLCKDLFSGAGNQPSGKYATTEDNSLTNVFEQMYIFYKLYPEKDFFSNVNPSVCGDDLAVSVSAQCSDFNNFYYRDAFKKFFGMDFTSPDKSEITTPFTALEDVDYLKRKFVYRPDLGRYVAQLDKDSLLKMTCFYLPSNSISAIKQWSQALTSCMYEQAMYMNEEQYCEFREKVLFSVPSYIGCERAELAIHLPGYDQVMEASFSESPFLRHGEETSLLGGVRIV